MKIVDSLTDPAVATCLHDGGIVIARTDTLYGMLAVAANEQAVNRVYQLKDRDERKSPIVLISRVDQLFDTPPDNVRAVMEAEWPGPVSISNPSTNAPMWIRRDNGRFAYRLPDYPELRELIGAVGPLAAPSANPEGEPPAMNIEEAIQYFGDEVDIYVDGGQVVDASPSRLLEVQTNGDILRIR